MWRGELVSIHIGPAAAQAMVTLDEVRAVASKGLEGDRYFLETGTFSAKTSPDRQLTLMEAEVFEAIERDMGITLAFAQSRRNLITRGVPLSHLVHQTFRVGSVLLRGRKINEPCAYFENLIGQPGLCQALLHRSGLNAEVLIGGILRVGDRIEPAPADV